MTGRHPQAPTGIRMARPSDAEVVQAIYAPYVADTAISFELEPPDAEEMGRRMETVSRRYPWLVYELDGEVVGYAYASAHRERAAYGWSADGAVYLAPQAHRRGIGRALYQRLVAILNLQGVHSLYGGITLPNAGSVGLHEACGFVRVGVYKEVGYKFGAWHDVGWWGLRLNSPAKDTTPPRSFSPSLFELTASADLVRSST